MKDITNEEIKKALEGLLHIVEMAMPDSYFESDTRVRRAKKLLKQLGKEWKTDMIKGSEYPEKD